MTAWPPQRAKPSKGFFIVLEGSDLSGKSTQAERLVRKLRKNHRVVHTREPGGTPLAETIRRLLLDVRWRIVPMAELFLYEAARAQHTEEKLRPSLEAGAIVVSERYTLATLAYQGYGRGLPLPLLRELNRISTGGLRPDLTLILDLQEPLFRRRSRGHRDRLEREPAAFARKVREGYRRLARQPGVILVDAGRSPDDVAAEIGESVKRVLRKRRFYGIS